MHRRPVYRRTAALALVAALGVMGARPAAAADLPDLRVMDRLAGLWSAASAGPVAFWGELVSWLGGVEKSATTESPTTDPMANQSYGSDPNGNE